MALTNTSVKHANPGSKSRKLYDEKGLLLLIQPSGAKYWRFKYRFGGKEKVLALGVYPEATLAEARRKRDMMRKLLADGIDPCEERRKVKRLQKVLAANSFESIAREWHDHQRGAWTKDHAESVLKSLEKEVFPALASRPVAEITPAELLDVVRAVEKRGALDVASRVLQRASSVFRYAIQTSRAERNPATDLRGALKTRKVAHRLALSRDELPEFLSKLETYDGHLLTRLALKLIVISFVRSHELRGARWDEFSLEHAEWRIPAERMKMWAAHLVPLSRQAIEVLEQIRPLTGRYELVFPNQNSPDKPMSENTLLFAMYRMGYHGRATPHGFRAVASTVLNESGFPPDVIERQLAHVERNKVRAAYHRSEYLEERRRMMQWWSDFLDGLATGANVIPLMTATKTF